MKKIHILMVSFVCLLLLGACANKSASVDEVQQQAPVQKQEKKKIIKQPSKRKMPNLK